MALRVSRLIGNTPELCLNDQQERDLRESEQRHREELSRIHALLKEGDRFLFLAKYLWYADLLAFKSLGRGCASYAA
mgnify:CR=1 FL=1